MRTHAKRVLDVDVEVDLDVDVELDVEVELEDHVEVELDVDVVLEDLLINSELSASMPYLLLMLRSLSISNSSVASLLT